MLSRVIDNMEFSDFEDRVPYQYSHYLRLNVSKTCSELEETSMPTPSTNHSIQHTMAIHLASIKMTSIKRKPLQCTTPISKQR